MEKTVKKVLASLAVLLLMAVSVDFRSSENLSKSTNEEFARLVAPYQVEIKKKPDRDAETIIVVSAGHGLDYLGEVKLMEPDSDFCWAKVKLNNNIGWVIVNKDWGEVVLIEGTFASADSSGCAVPPTPWGKLIAVSEIEVKEEASDDSAIIAALPIQTKVEFTGHLKSTPQWVWAKVKMPIPKGVRFGWVRFGTNWKEE